MHINTQAAQAPGEIVVEFHQVFLEDLPSYDVGMEDVTFDLRHGELALIKLEQGAKNHPLPDVLCGLQPPDRGIVKVFAQRWTALRPDDQARARGRIGRVFEAHGWLNNLDIDENVTLGERHHTFRSEQDIYEEAGQLARQAGLPELPQIRPAVAEHEHVRRAEWVRALLGSPWLLILDRPGLDLAPGWLHQLLPMVQKIRDRGGAVIWLCEGHDEWMDPGINPSLKLIAEKNKLRTLSAT